MPSLPPPTPGVPPPKPTARYSIPTSIRIATSDAPRDEASEASAFSSLNASAEARALATRNLSLLNSRLELVELLSEPASPLATLRSGLAILDATTWDDLMEERHATNLCPYPTCARRPGTPYAPDDSQAKLSVRMVSNGLFAGGKSKGASPHGAFCSAKCRARSDWFRTMLGTERLEMLEDVEERRREVSKGTEGILERTEAKASEGTAAAAARTTSVASEATRDAVDRLPTGQLSIVERPTPSTTPSAPNPSTRIDFERPASASAAPLSLTRTRTPRSALSSSSALLPFDTTILAKTVLRSTTSARPPPTRAQPTTGLNGLPPPRWRSDPVMLDSEGREVEWAGDREDTEMEAEMMDEGVRLMREMRERGEL
ncbi:hypothetical protein RQP46_008612 [Phenoliferia psychrophenolica]